MVIGDMFTSLAIVLGPHPVRVTIDMWDNASHWILHGEKPWLGTLGPNNSGHVLGVDIPLKT